jgi:putative transcriptional regulator
VDEDKTGTIMEMTEMTETTENGTTTTSLAGADSGALTNEGSGLYCGLNTLMKRANIPTMVRLAELSFVNRNALTKLAQGTARLLNPHHLASLCRVLDCEIGELLQVPRHDIWDVARRTRSAVIHLPSRSLDDWGRVVDPADLKYAVDREYIGIWDFHAVTTVSAYLRSICTGIEVLFDIDQSGPRLAGAASKGSELSYLGDGRLHVLVGSPASSDLSEDLVSALYGVASCTPELHGAFPLNFDWPHHRSVISSFGRTAVGKECGIVDSKTREFVARRTFIDHGPGEDCAMVVTSRTLHQGGDEGMIIACLGHSGPGTFAAAQAVTRPGIAVQLYPSEPDVPVMRAIQAEYTRPDLPTHRDNRKLKSWELVDREEVEA